MIRNSQGWDEGSDEERRKAVEREKHTSITSSRKVEMAGGGNLCEKKIWERRKRG